MDWTADLDRCAMCSSVHLVRRLGEAECRDCGWAGLPVPAPTLAIDDAAAGQAASEGGSLAEEVERALSRVLGTPAQRPPFAMS